MRSKFRIQLSLLAFLLVCTLCTFASAEDVNFYISTLFPENQTDPSLGVYDLMMKPEQKQRLEVIIVNQGEEPLRVTVGAYGGHTTDTGMIYYSADAPVESANPPPAVFEDLVKPVVETISIEPLSQASCMLDVQMPKEAYDGVVHGAVVVTQVLENDGPGEAGGMRIRNRIQYALGIRLRMSDKEVAPSFVLDGARMNAENRLELKLRNAAAVLGLPMAMEIDVVSPDTGESAFAYAQPLLSMAANSTMNYAVPNFSGEEQIAPGQYTVKVQLKFGEDTYNLSAPLTVYEQK